MIHAIARMFRRLRRRDDGALTAEFAFAAPVMLLAMVGTIELGMVMFVTTLMESALRDAARFGITGQEITGQTCLERILEIVSDRTLGLVDMTDANVEVVIYPSFAEIGNGEDFVDGDGDGSYDVGETFTDSNGNGVWDSDISVAGPGDAGDIVVYRMRYDWPLLTPLVEPVIGQDGSFGIRAAVAVRNEPWDTAPGG